MLILAHTLRFHFLAMVLVGLLPLASWSKNLTHLSSYNSSNVELLDVEISDTYAYVPGGLGGLNIIDISNPSVPFTVAEYSAYGCEYGRLYAWHVSGGYAYGSGRNCGIKVLDVSDPRNPIKIADYQSQRSPSYEQTDSFDFPEGESYLFAATHTSGVEIVNISRPSSPKFVATVPTQNAWAVEVSESGDFVYVADGAGGLKIIAISSPAEAFLVGGAESSGTAKDVVAVGNYVLVAVGAGGVDMFDVSDPEHPLLVTNYNTTGYASRVAVSDRLVAVSDWDDVEVLEWDDSPSLTLAAYKNTGGRVMAINMIDNVIFSAEWSRFRSFRFGKIEDPDIDLSLWNVDFPHTDAGTCRDTVFSITNSGRSSLDLSSLSINHDDYAISFPAHAIEPGATVEGMITYCASSERGYASLTIESNDPDEPRVRVSLEGNSPWGIESGEEAPDFKLPVVNGQGDITLSQLRGKIVVVTFFASW